MKIIGNFNLSVPLVQHLQHRLHQQPNTAIQVRGFVADNPTQERVVIKTDLAGWQQVGQVMKQYGIA